MFLKFNRFRIWIPTIMSFLGSERLTLNKNNKYRQVESKSKQYVKGMNQSKGNKIRFYSRNK